MTVWNPPVLYHDYLARWRPPHRPAWGLLFLLVAALLVLACAWHARAEEPQQAIIMVPAGLSPSGEPLTFEGTCEPSRVYAPMLECRAMEKGE